MGVDLRFSEEPDWDWLRGHYAGTGLLHDCAFGFAAARCRAGQTYLATPYTRQVRRSDGRWCPIRSDEIAERAAWWALHCAVNGVAAVAPVVQAQAMVTVDGGRAVDPLDGGFWAKITMPMLMASRAVIVPPIAGWAESRGIWRETRWALRHRMAVFLIKQGSEYEAAA